MWFLSTRYPYWDEVDLGIKALGDQTVQAENQIGTRQMEKDQCIR
jgi:hypothetical protein